MRTVGTQCEVAATASEGVLLLGIVVLSPRSALARLMREAHYAVPKTETSPRGRDARTGHFTTVKKAREHASTHVVERVPKPGYGDTKKK